MRVHIKAISIILPTFNEADNIVPLITALSGALPIGSELIVVDDDSPDGTAERVRPLAERPPAGMSVRIIVRTANHGLTNSLRDGIAAARHGIIGWMDCDFSHPPAVIPALMEKLLDGADIALAARKDFPGLSGFLNRLCMVLFGRDVTDYTTGFLVAKRSVTDALPLQGDYGEYCIRFLVEAKRQGFAIAEVPYDSPPRRAGQTKTSPDISTLVRHGTGYIRTIIRLAKH